MRRIHITAWAGAVIAALIAGCAGTAGRDGGAEIEKVMAGSHRSDANRARDVYRHPRETLQFFGVRPDSTVVEIWPGGGWYTEILAPLLREKGRYYAAHFHVTEKSPKYMGPARASFLKTLASRPELYDRVTVTALDAPAATDIAPRGSADFVLTFRNVHNWTAAKNDEAMFKAFYDALKPGGTLGVTEHRAAPGTSLEQQIKTGYMTEAYVISLAEKAGFRLAGRSEVNANPKDTKDHPAGVWTLPPTYRLKDQDREKYRAIGESDRMTLKFIKPAS
jgi:predicted methyltransferase